MKRLLHTIIAFIALILTSSLPLHAVVTFEANEIQGEGQYTKNGVTISKSKEMLGNFSVSSTVGDFVMIVLEYESFKPYEDHTVNRYFHPSTGSFYNFEILEWPGPYGIWEGQTSSCDFNGKADTKRIHIYLNGDELPKKGPIAIVSLTNNYSSFYTHIELDFVYGYTQFDDGYKWANLDDEYKLDYASITYYIVKEDGLVPKWTGGPYHEITFDDSFAEYKPKSTSHWFDGVKMNQYGKVDFKNLNLSDVTDMSYMFKGSDIDFENLDYSKVKNLSNLFSGYEKRAFDLSSWSFDSSQKVTEMFKNSNVVLLTVSSSINNANNDIFKGLGSSSNPCFLIVNEGEDIDANVSNNVFTFKSGYFKLSPLEAYVVKSDKEDNNIDSDYHCNRYYNLHYDCYKPYYSSMKGVNNTYYININTWPIYVEECVKDVFPIDNEDDRKRWISDYNYLSSEYEGPDPWESNKHVVIVSSFEGYENMHGLFQGLHAETIENLEILNTSSVKDMSYMFAGSDVSSLGLSHFDTSNVTDMSHMFAGCVNLESLDLSHFNTSNVTE